MCVFLESLSMLMCFNLLQPEGCFCLLQTAVFFFFVFASLCVPSNKYTCIQSHTHTYCMFGNWLHNQICIKGLKHKQKLAITHHCRTSVMHIPMPKCISIHTYTVKITNHPSRQSRLNPKGSWLCNFGWKAAILYGIMATIRLKAVSFQYQSGCNEGWMTLGKGTIAQILLLINVADVRNMN